MKKIIKQIASNQRAKKSTAAARFVPAEHAIIWMTFLYNLIFTWRGLWRGFQRRVEGVEWGWSGDGVGNEHCAGGNLQCVHVRGLPKQVQLFCTLPARLKGQESFPEQQEKNDRA